jgi:hypothetical protein
VGARVKTGERAAASDALRLPTTVPRRAERRAGVVATLAASILQVAVRECSRKLVPGRRKR